MERLTERFHGDGLCYGKIDCEDNCSYCNRFLKVLDKLADYEDIGTVEEFKELKKKNQPKKPYYVQYDINPNIGNWHCPSCEGFVLYTHRNCKCGQVLDWE